MNVMCSEQIEQHRGVPEAQFKVDERHVLSSK